MTGVNSSGGTCVCRVFLTNLDEIGSLDHTRMQIHTTINVQTTNKQNKQTKRKGKSPSLV